MYNIFIIIFRANCLFFCADRINFLLLLFHFEPFYFFSTYVRPKGTCIRRHTTCLSLWLRIIDAIILLFWSSFLGLIKVQIFYISVFYSYITIILIFLLYNCCFFCYYFVIFFCKPALYSVDCTNWWCTFCDAPTWCNFALYFCIIPRMSLTKYELY